MHVISVQNSEISMEFMLPEVKKYTTPVPQKRYQLSKSEGQPNSSFDYFSY